MGLNTLNKHMVLIFMTKYTNGLFQNNICYFIDVECVHNFTAAAGKGWTTLITVNTARLLDL